MGILSGIFRRATDAYGNEQTADSMLKECFWYYQWSVEDVGLGALPVKYVAKAWELFLKDQHPNQLVIFGARKDQAIFDSVAQFACLPDPDCGHAISIYIFSQKFPQIAARFPKYEALFGEALGEVAFEISSIP